MHPSYANILDILPLNLKQTKLSPTSEYADEVIELSEQMVFDIGLVHPQLNLKVVQRGNDIAIHDQNLILPTEQLNLEQKRQLWKLISEY
jgi:hypothetical protein